MVGARDLGLQVAAELLAHHEPVLVLDDDHIRVARAVQQGHSAMQIDLLSNGGSASSMLEGARALVCTYEDSETNLRICRYAHSQIGLGRVISVVSDPTYASQFEREGVFPVVVGLARSRLLTLLARNPSVYELLTRTDDDKEVWEVTVRNPQVLDKALHELHLPGDVLILTVRRDGDLLVPHGDTRLNQGDLLTLVGSDDFVELTQQAFG